MKSFMLVLTLSFSGLAFAQDAAPAANTAPSTEDDAPIGLFITPWRNEAATRTEDRPARLLQADLSPIDQTVFDRQVIYYDVLEAHSAKKAAAAATPATP